MDIGDIVANAATGARFRDVAGLGGGGRCRRHRRLRRDGRPRRGGLRTARSSISCVSGSASGSAWPTWLASFFINLLTLVAEVAGVAVALELATDVNYLLWLPLVALLVWIVIWRVKFDTMETRRRPHRPQPAGRSPSAVWQAHPDWGHLVGTATSPAVPQGEGHADVLLLRDRPVRGGDDALRGVLLLLGRGRGALDDARISIENRANVFIGFPLGGFLSLALMACATRRARARGHRRRPLCRRPRCPRPWSLGQGRAGPDHRRLLRRHVRRRAGDRACRRATRSRSTSAGSGASCVAPRRRRRFHLVIAGLDRRWPCSSSSPRSIR